jgi:hypothetical protein
VSSRRLRSADQIQDTPFTAVSHNPSQTEAGGKTRSPSPRRPREYRHDTPKSATTATRRRGASIDPTTGAILEEVPQPRTSRARPHPTRRRPHPADRRAAADQPRPRTRPQEDDAATRQKAEAAHTKAECALRDHPTLGRWLRQSPTGRLSINRAKIKAEERLDGKYLIATSDPHLSAEDTALGYKNLLEAERGFRDPKSSLLLRPVFHRLEHASAPTSCSAGWRCCSSGSLNAAPA